MPCSHSRGCARTSFATLQGPSEPSQPAVFSAKWKDRTNLPSCHVPSVLRQQVLWEGTRVWRQVEWGVTGAVGVSGGHRPWHTMLLQMAGAGSPPRGLWFGMGGPGGLRPVEVVAVVPPLLWACISHKWEGTGAGLRPHQWLPSPLPFPRSCRTLLRIHCHQEDFLDYSPSPLFPVPRSQWTLTQFISAPCEGSQHWWWRWG